MSTVIRAEVSKGSQYYIPKHRFLELKHFCMQYPDWKKEMLAYDSYSRIGFADIHRKEVGDPTLRAVEQRERYARFTSMVEQVASETDPVIGGAIMRGIIFGSSYDAMRTREGIPCCRDTYYDLYRKFFFILDKRRDA